MQNALRALIVAATLWIPSFSHANLLIDPGFETGSATAWSRTGNIFIALCSSFGCAPDGGDYYATVNNTRTPFGTGDSSLTQTVMLPGAGIYEFGAMVVFGTILPSDGNFAQGQISLTGQFAGGPTATVGRDPNALSGLFTDTRFVGFLGFSFTDWFPLVGTLNYTGEGPAPFLLNINIQNATEQSRLVLLVDNVFVRGLTVPEPGSIALLGAALFGLGLARMRRKS